MPALGGASAENLRFLDYLIYEPVRTVLLHQEGVSVLVPTPERFAVHKLIIASRRQVDAFGRAKADKDLAQAALLFDAVTSLRQADLIAEPWQEAWDRGDSWKEALRKGFARLPDNDIEALQSALGSDVITGLS